MTKTTISIKEVLQISSLLDNHIPEQISPNVVEFVGTIIRSMIKSGESRNFVTCLSIMLDATDDDIVAMDKQDALQMFVECFIKFNLWDGIMFYRTLRKSEHGR